MNFTGEFLYRVIEELRVTGFFSSDEWGSKESGSPARRKTTRPTDSGKSYYLPSVKLKQKTEPWPTDWHLLTEGGGRLQS